MDLRYDGNKSAYAKINGNIDGVELSGEGFYDGSQAGFRSEELNTKWITISQSDIEDLLDERIFLREKGAGTRDLLDSYLKTYNLTYSDFKNYVEVESISSIISLLKNDCGIAFIYRLAASEELASGALKEVNIQNLPLHHDTSFIWNKNSIFSKRYRTICEELMSYEPMK